MKTRTGVHTSITGGISKAVERAVELKCTTMQIFTHNPRQWKQSLIKDYEARRFKTLRKKHDIYPVFSHASYLINLASYNDTILSKSIELLSYELMNADRLGIEYVVLHTGSSGGIDAGKARIRAVRAIRKALETDQYRSSLLLENTAGEKGDITSSIHTLAEIMDKCGSNAHTAGICIDTCHAFSAGYDLRSREGVEKLFSEVEKYAGIERLKLIHLNDSRKPLGSGVDRHEHIGKGHIGTEGFRNLLHDSRCAHIPIILETPKKSEDDDRINLEIVSEIIEEINFSG